MDDAALLVLSAAADGVTALWNLRTLTAAAAPMRDNVAVPRSLALLPAPTDAGAPSDVFVSAAANAPALLLYSVRRDAPLFKCSMPEAMLATAASRDGRYVAAGGASGKAYLWDGVSGELLRSWQAAHRAVTAAVWSPCGTLLVTGSHEGSIAGWPLASVLDTTDTATPPAPRFTLLDHSLAVSALVYGPGLGGAARLYSASADRTVRLWDTAAGRLLHTLAFPAAVASVAVDCFEGRLLAACGDGGVYVVDLGAAIARARAPTAALVPIATASSAAGGSGRSAAAEVARALAIAAGGSGGGGGGGGSGSGVAHAALLGHVGAVSSVALSDDGATAVSGGADCKVRVWDVASRQQVAVYDGHEAPVTSVILMRRPASLGRLGRSGTSVEAGAGAVLAGSGSGLGGARVVMPFMKHAAVAAREPATAPTVAVPIAPTTWRPQDVTAINAALSDAIACMLHPAASGVSATAPAPPPPRADGEVAELHAQVATLRDEVARWKAVNTQLLARLSAAGGLPAPPTAAGDGSPAGAGSKRGRGP